MGQGEAMPAEISKQVTSVIPFYGKTISGKLDLTGNLANNEAT